MRMAVDGDAPRRTRRQETRWSTQDEAFASAPAGQATVILNFLRERPSTCDEVEVALGMTHQSASASVNKLMRMGLIVANGTRKTRSNRNAKVWEVPNGG
jgi:DNA-binding MarR family transcriptional regulator